MRSFLVFLHPLLAFLFLLPSPAAAGSLVGSIRQSAVPQNVVLNARMTLFTPDLTFFREARSGASGDYTFADVPPGTYRLGCAAVGFDYVETEAAVPAAGGTQDFALGPLTQTGRWDTVGNTLPEFLDATDIALLLPDGRIFYCHDTTDPLLFDPATGQKSFPSASPSEQGCMNGSLLGDGSVIMVGGQDGADPGSFRNAIPWVKVYDPTNDAWAVLPNLQHDAGRWYPGMARLADGSFLVMGGGTAPNAQRTATCERFESGSQTWTYTAAMQNPSEFSPCALLFTGDVLATWWPPQLYDPALGTWRPAGNFVQPNRFWPGHSDHSLVVLADGRAVALGVVSGPNGNSVMGEIYDPGTETWTLTSNPGLVRYQTEVVQLPDGKIMVAGGETEVDPAPVPDVLGIVRWCDLYDPAADSWRRVADMSVYREYHAVTLLVPDGRVLTTGGTRIKFQVGPTSADIEAYSPPYLFRGVRPRITGVSSIAAVRGDLITLTITPETEITTVVLMGVQSTTHWVDGGIPRRLVLPVSQTGTTVDVVLPVDPNVLPLGHYMLFAMVDDIPSEGAMLLVTPPATSVTEAWTQLLRVHAPTPNPFPVMTHLRYELEHASAVTLRVFDVRGLLVRRLSALDWRDPGPHDMVWDGRNDQGKTVASGVYLFRIEAGGTVRNGRLVVAR